MTGTQLVPESAIKLIHARGYDVRHVEQDLFDPDDLHKVLDGVAGYLIGGFEEVSAEHVRAATRLEAVAWLGTDYEGHVPGWREAFDRGVAVINTPGANADAVAEFTITMALMMARPVIPAIVEPGIRAVTQVQPGRELGGMSLGIVGLGRIGSRVAALARGFDMRVYYCGPNRHPDLEQRHGIGYLTKAELLSTVDVVSLHRPAPQADESAELGPSEFQRMRPGTIILNTGHPRLVDLAGLLVAANDMNIRAAFDGLGEGPVWNDLLRLGPARFLAFPMVAFNTVDANERVSLTAARAVCDVLDGGTSELVNNPRPPGDPARGRKLRRHSKIA